MKEAKWSIMYRNSTQYKYIGRYTLEEAIFISFKIECQTFAKHTHIMC